MSVIFDQLRISDDGKRMYLNVHVNKASPDFDNVYIDSITIMTSDKVLEATDAKEPTSDYIYKKTFGDDEYEKEVNMVLTAADFIKQWEEDPQAMKFYSSDMSNTLFFVYIKVKGPFGECTPCTLDEEVSVGVTFDENILYQQVMGFTKQLTEDCTPSQGFTDFILQWNAFKAAIETEHYIPAIDFWKRLFGNGSTSFGITKSCGCHG